MSTMATTAPLCLPLHPVKPVKRQCQVCCLPGSVFNLRVYYRYIEKDEVKNMHYSPNHVISDSQ